MRKWIYWFCMILVTGCTKDIDISTGTTESKYVVEGRISNMVGPYFFRITKSTSRINTDEEPEAVTDALVILSDDTGIKDTLILLDTTKLHLYSYLYHDNVIDSIQYRLYSFPYTPERGYYQTTHIKGIPGRTYHLQVRIGQEEFHALAHMPPVPALDSAVIKRTVVVPNGLEGYLPFAYFKEPQHEKNYYMLQYNSLQYYRYDLPDILNLLDYAFSNYIVDDQLLPPYVDGLAIRPTYSGHDPSGNTYTSVRPEEPLQVRLCSITKEAYDYFKVLIAQFDHDGNAYKPVPASAQGNISGGALGLFYATHISDKLILP